MLHLGIDIGGTNLKLAIIDENYHLISFDNAKLLIHENREAILNSITEKIDNFCKKYNDISTIGFGVPGIVSDDGYIVVSPNIPQFSDLHIAEYFAKTINKNIRIQSIKVDNDANVAALTELKIGKGVGKSNFIYLTIGTGLGGAIIINHHIFRGDNGAAGEIGHYIFDPFSDDNDNRDYRKGVLENYLSKRGIAKIAENLIEKYPNSRIITENKWDVKSISDFADNGDAHSIEVFKIAGEYLGLAVATLANIFDISTFIIGGGISKSTAYFNQIAIKTANNRVLPHLQGKIHIEKSEYNEQTGAIGAAILGSFV